MVSFTITRNVLETQTFLSFVKTHAKIEYILLNEQQLLVLNSIVLIRSLCVAHPEMKK